MSEQEFSRLEVLLRVQSGRLRVADACVLIGLQRRQVFRLLRGLKQDGAASLLSKHRGKPSNHRLPVEVRILALAIVRERYPDFGPTLAAEKLAEHHGCSVSREMESYQGDADDEYRGRGGPLKVTESNESGAIYDALIKAAGEVGIAYTKDYNGATQDGIGMTQTTIRGGRRMSTAVCYLDPARRRPNLTIQTNALTECLLLEGKRCVGVRYNMNGQQHEARAN